MSSLNPGIGFAQPPDCGIYCTTPVPINTYSEQLKGGTKATRVAVGTTGSVWAVSDVAFDAIGNLRVFEYVNDSFVVRPDAGAVRTAVDDQGTPWLVNAQGFIFRQRADKSGWQLMPGAAREIAAGRPKANLEGLVWVIGTKMVEDENYEIYKRGRCERLVARSGGRNANRC